MFDDIEYFDYDTFTHKIAVGDKRYASRRYIRVYKGDFDFMNVEMYEDGKLRLNFAYDVSRPIEETERNREAYFERYRGNWKLYAIRVTPTCFEHWRNIFK